jgi:predicted nucleic acid-binding protein
VTAPDEGTGWLIDKSALVGLGASADAEVWADRIERGLVRIATVTLLEVGYSARSAADLRAGFTEPPIASMPIEYATPVSEDRAVQVLNVLAERGHHRAPSIPDLLIASIAESAGLAVLHDDKHFDLIAEVTGQRVERLRDRP